MNTVLPKVTLKFTYECSNIGKKYNSYSILIKSVSTKNKVKYVYNMTIIKKV